MKQIEIEAMRHMALERDGFRCTVCGETKRALLETHHVIPVNLGGLDTLENLRSLCIRCHRGVEPKRTRIPRRRVFVFVGTISDYGKNRIIYIPRSLHKAIKPFRKKQIRISINELDES